MFMACVLFVYTASFFVAIKPMYGIYAVSGPGAPSLGPSPTRLYFSTRNVPANRCAGVVFWPMIKIVDLLYPVEYVWDASASRLD